VARGAPPSTSPGSLRMFRFDIPAGTLQSALESFRKRTGYTTSQAREGIGRLSSPGVAGRYTPEQALRKLLSGTGVAYQLSGSVAILDLAANATSIEIIGTVQPISASIPKHTEPLIDTPWVPTNMMAAI
jgi:hypothetical protein